MEIKIHKPTERERKTEAELKAAKASIQPIKEKGRNDRINRKIRERYSLSEELSIIRHALMAVIDHTELPEEFKDFAAFVERCKEEDGE